MRLIDADELSIRTHFNENDCIDTEDILNAPTVDAVPVVHGHWIKATGMMPPEYTGRHVCSVCNYFAPNEFHSREWLSPICPNCGTKMDILVRES